MREDEKSRTIRTMRFIVSLVIVLLHGMNLSQFNVVKGSFVYCYEKVLTEYIYSCAVPTLFVISGYLMFKNLGWDSFKDKARRRVKSLIIPYICWNCISMIYFQLFTYIPGVKERISIIPIRNLGGILQGLLLFSNNEINWFLFQLIIFMLIVPAVILIKKSRFLFTFVIIIILIITVLIGTNILNVVGVVSVNSFEPCLRVDCLFYYLVGGFLATYSINIGVNKYICMGSTILGLLLMYISYSLNVYTFCIGAIALIYAFYYFLCNNYIFIEKILKNYYEINVFFILEIHYMILYPLKKIFSAVFYGNEIIALICYIILPIVSILISCMLNRIIKKRFIRVYNYLVGFR